MNLVLSFFLRKVIFSLSSPSSKAVKEFVIMVCITIKKQAKEARVARVASFEKESRGGEQYVVVTAAKNGLFTAPETSSSASSLKSESTVSNTQLPKTQNSSGILITFINCGKRIPGIPRILRYWFRPVFRNPLSQKSGMFR